MKKAKECSKKEEGKRMEIIADAFGWILDVQKKPIKDLDLSTMASKIRATQRLTGMWERELAEAINEYSDAVSVEANVARSTVARRLSLQRGLIVAKRVNMLSSALNMLNCISGVADRIKMLESFYMNVFSVRPLPRDMSVELFARQMLAMYDDGSDNKADIDRLEDSLGEDGTAISEAPDDEEIENQTAELGALYEEYCAKLDKNDQDGADEVLAKIKLKTSEVDKQMVRAPLRKRECSDKMGNVSIGKKLMVALGIKPARIKTSDVRNKIWELKCKAKEYENQAEVEESLALENRTMMFSPDTLPADRKLFMRESGQCAQRAKMHASLAGSLIAQIGDLTELETTMLIVDEMNEVGLIGYNSSAVDLQNAMASMPGEIQRMISANQKFWEVKGDEFADSPSVKSYFDEIRRQTAMLEVAEDSVKQT